MNSENSFKQIKYENSNAVVSFKNETTFKIKNFMEYIDGFFGESQLLDNLSEKLQESGIGTPPNYQSRYWNSGVEVEILEPQYREWKKGKMRLRVILEFCPDEPEVIKNNNMEQNNNSLDDIRQTIS